MPATACRASAPATTCRAGLRASRGLLRQVRSGRRTCRSQSGQYSSGDRADPHGCCDQVDQHSGGDRSGVHAWCGRSGQRSCGDRSGLHAWCGRSGQRSCGNRSGLHAGCGRSGQHSCGDWSGRHDWLGQHPHRDGSGLYAAGRASSPTPPPPVAGGSARLGRLGEPAHLLGPVGQHVSGELWSYSLGQSRHQKAWGGRRRASRQAWPYTGTILPRRLVLALNITGNYIPRGEPSL